MKESIWQNTTFFHHKNPHHVRNRGNIPQINKGPLWKTHNQHSQQFYSVAQSCLAFCNHMDCSNPGLPVHHQLPEFTQTHVHWVGDAIRPFHPLLFPSPLAFNLSQHYILFKRVSFSHQVTKALEFQLQQSPFDEYLGLISFRMEWLEVLAVQGTLKSLLQHHRSK